MKLFQKSLPATVRVRGYVISRLPLGGYLQALESIKTFPEGILAACFPGQALPEILAGLKSLDEKKLTLLLGNLFTVAPRYLIRVVAELTQISEEQLLTDTVIGLDGLTEIILKFWEINGLSNFMAAIREIAAQYKMTAGSKT